MVEVMKIMVTFSKGPMHALLHSVTQTLQQATANPGLCKAWTLMVKSGSISCVVTAPFSWVLVHTRFLFVPSRSLFPQPCASSGGSMVELMVTPRDKHF